MLKIQCFSLLTKRIVEKSEAEYKEFEPQLKFKPRLRYG